MADATYAVGGVAVLGPDAISADHKAMCAYWEQIDAILGGSKAMRACRERFLPKFINETLADYDFRCKNSKFTNVFRDIVENLAAKPFADEANVDEKASDRIKELAENIDGQGNHIHVFAAASFFSGIAYAVEWILVDYTKDVPPNATVAKENAIGARPYWVSIPAKRLLAAYSAMIGGVEQFVHVRIAEDYCEREGYAEKLIKRVRILDRAPIYVEGRKEAVGYGPATYQVLEAVAAPTGQAQWAEVERGILTIGVIPLVAFLTGRRIGSSWQIVPPMQDAADLQIELFQQESGLKYIKEMTTFPMLAGNGVTPAMGDDGTPASVPVGPKSVLYAPMDGNGQHGEWTFIEPSAESLRFLADDVKETIQQLRELGRQPLTAQTGNLTVVTTQFAAQKGNSAIQAWALNLKDAMENALRYTVMWLKEDAEPEFLISLDFDLGLNDEKGPDTLLKMRESGDLSRETLWHEMRRRSILSPEFDAEEEEQLLLDEVPGGANEADGVDAMGNPIVPQPIARAA